MRHYPIALLLGCLLAACKPAPDASPQRPAPAAAQSETADQSAYDLRGEWAVSRLDGQTLDYRVPFVGSSDALQWIPDCAMQEISYRTDGDQLVFEKERFDEPPIVCDIGFPAELPRVLTALEGRWDVRREDNGDLVLSKAGENITLEKLPVAVIETLAGEWRVAGVDGKALDEPYAIALSADESEIWWDPRCARQIVPYRIVNERFLVEYPPDAPPVPDPVPGATPVPPPPVCTIGLPSRLADVMSAIASADRIERLPSNGVRLSGGDRSVTLFSQ